MIMAQSAVIACKQRRGVF